MTIIPLEIPEESLHALRVPLELAGKELLMLAAVKLFELRRLSSGAAAEFAGVCKPEFLQRLGSYGALTFDMTAEEFDRETSLLDHVGKLVDPNFTMRREDLYGDNGR